jgi:hypothetical protein
MPIEVFPILNPKLNDPSCSPEVVAGRLVEVYEHVISAGGKMIAEHSFMMYSRIDNSQNGYVSFLVADMPDGSAEGSNVSLSKDPSTDQA